MMIDVTVPVLAESVPDATLLEWNKQVGEAVTAGEILIELETDKVVLEVPAPADGVMAEILKQEGDTALSEEVIARIDSEATASVAPAAASEPAPAPATPSATPPPSPAPSGLSPAVTRIVAENQLDAAEISGTGRDGRITKGDALNAMETQSAPSPAPAATPARPMPTPGSRGERRESMSRLRSRIAERLLESQQTTASLTTFNEVNMKPMMDLRNRYKESFEKEFGVRLGFMSFFTKASVVALQRFPEVNAYIDGNEIVYHDYCDVGIAVGSPRGLVVPVLRNAESMSFADIELKIGEYGDKAGDGSLRIEDMTGGTFTISNGGVFGSLLSTPILNPPQSAILGMHKTEQRPVVENGEIVIRPMMYLALTYDHRDHGSGQGKAGFGRTRNCFGLAAFFGLNPRKRT
ncbi:MAG: 2-oxoglutarate dehydrogenase complex dihydrolipoyllysine-residue succinyltransferase [Pseudomonadota bacterium]